MIRVFHFEQNLAPAYLNLSRWLSLLILRPAITDHQLQAIRLWNGSMKRPHVTVLLQSYVIVRNSNLPTVSTLSRLRRKWRGRIENIIWWKRLVFGSHQHTLYTTAPRCCLLESLSFQSRRSVGWNFPTVRGCGRRDYNEGWRYHHLPYWRLSRSLRRGTYGSCILETQGNSITAQGPCFTAHSCCFAACSPCFFKAPRSHHTRWIINHRDLSISNINSDNGCKADPRWHSASFGEIFHTDGVLRKEAYPGVFGDGICFNFYWCDLRDWYHRILGLLDCYTAINSSGKKACKYLHTLANWKNFPMKPFIRSYFCTWVHTSLSWIFSYN